MRRTLVGVKPARLSVVLLGLVVASCARSDAPRSLQVSSDTGTETTKVATATTLSTQMPPAFSNEPVERFARYRAMRHVRQLAAKIGIRVRATTGERLGARYAARRFRALGYEVKIQKFSIDGGTSRNVIAWWPGSVAYPLVIGEHVDSVPGSPGANDNASGVAAILEVARVIAGKAPSRFVRFVAFGSEEYGRDGTHHDGSAVMVRRMGDQGRRRLPGMISVDMVADGRPLLLGHSGIGPPDMARMLYRRVRRTGIRVERRTLCDCSDNGPFEHAGIPAAFMYSGPEPDYHSSSDTPANMHPRDLLRTGRALRAFVLTLDRRTLDSLRSR